MPTKKRPYGLRKYGVEDSAGNILILPHFSSASDIFEAAAKLADTKGESVYLFEVGRRLPHTAMGRKKVEPLRRSTPVPRKTSAQVVEAMAHPWRDDSGTRHKTSAQLSREVAEAMARPWRDEE